MCVCSCWKMRLEATVNDLWYDSVWWFCSLARSFFHSLFVIRWYCDMFHSIVCIRCLVLYRTYRIHIEAWLLLPFIDNNNCRWQWHCLVLCSVHVSIFTFSCQLWVAGSEIDARKADNRQRKYFASICVCACVYFCEGGRGRECDQEWFSDRSKFFF